LKGFLKLAIAINNKRETIMRSNLIRIQAFVFAFMSLAVIANGLAKENIWTIGPRRLPPSVDVSDEFREVMLNTPAPDVKAVKKNVPETTEQWITMIRALDDKTAAVARKLAQTLSV
jgi:hypothetical protein